MEGRCERLRQRQERTAPFASSSSAKMSLRSLVLYFPQIPKGHLVRHVTRRWRIIITEKMPRRIKESKKRLKEIFNCFGEGATGSERGPILLFKAARCPRVTDGAAMRGHHLQKKRRRPLVRRRRRLVFFYLFSVSYAQEDYRARAQQTRASALHNTPMKRGGGLGIVSKKTHNSIVTSTSSSVGGGNRVFSPIPSITSSFFLSLFPLFLFFFCFLFFYFFQPIRPTLRHTPTRSSTESLFKNS
jgi:hypothetical protein